MIHVHWLDPIDLWLFCEQILEHLPDHGTIGGWFSSNMLDAAPRSEATEISRRKSVGEDQEEGGRPAPNPPSTMRDDPVTNEASSLARKTAAFATS